MSILIISYLRADHILGYLPVLVSAGLTEVYLAIDGTKNLADQFEQDSMVDKITSEFKKNGINLWIWRRSKNLGAAVSVITAVDWFFSWEEKGIILEDDLYLSNSFVGFAAKCLTDFAEQPDIWLISGNQFFNRSSEEINPIFTHYPLIWGWATWRNKWQEMRAAILSENVKGRIKIDSAEYAFWSTGRSRSLSGKIDAWDIPLVLFMLTHNKLCALPPVNLVSNIGADAYSTHTTSPSWPLMQSTNTLEIQEANYNLTSSDEIAKEDGILSKDFYRVKRRHILLPFYRSLIDLVRPTKFPSSLQKRLQEVTLPKSREFHK
jgi:hypothetical protein